MYTIYLDIFAEQHFQKSSYMVSWTYKCILPIILYCLTIAVEKNNDDARRYYNSSNRWDGPKDILLTEARLEELEEYECPTRSYTKKTSCSELETNDDSLMEKRRRTSEMEDETESGEEDQVEMEDQALEETRTL